MPGVHASQTPSLPSSQKKGEPDWRTWAGRAKPAWSYPVPLPCPVGENDCGAGGSLFQCSPFLRGQGARSRVTTAGLPLLAPCTCLGLKRGGRWPERSALPPRVEGSPGQVVVDTERFSSTHICACRTALSLAVRDAGASSVPGAESCPVSLPLGPVLPRRTGGTLSPGASASSG